MALSIAEQLERLRTASIANPVVVRLKWSPTDEALFTKVIDWAESTDGAIWFADKDHNITDILKAYQWRVFGPDENVDETAPYLIELVPPIITHRPNCPTRTGHPYAKCECFTG